MRNINITERESESVKKSNVDSAGRVKNKRAAENRDLETEMPAC